MKNILIGIVVALFIIFFLFYLKPIHVLDVIEINNNDNLPDKIIAYVYTSYSTEQYEINNHENIKEIVNALLNIKVRHKLIKIKTYSPEFRNTFNLIFYDSIDMDMNQYINVFNRKYIQINDKHYYIIDMPNLSDIYDIIVID